MFYINPRQSGPRRPYDAASHWNGGNCRLGRDAVGPVTVFRVRNGFEETAGIAALLHRWDRAARHITDVAERERAIAMCCPDPHTQILSPQRAVDGLPPVAKFHPKQRHGYLAGLAVVASNMAADRAAKVV